MKRWQKPVRFFQIFFRGIRSLGHISSTKQTVMWNKTSWTDPFSFSGPCWKNWKAVSCISVVEAKQQSAFAFHIMESKEGPGIFSSRTLNCLTCKDENKFYKATLSTFQLGNKARLFFQNITLAVYCHLV